MKIQFKPRYQVRKVLRNGEILVWDFKEERVVVMTARMWEARSGFLMLVVNGEIIP